MKLVLISDTHTLHHRLKIPKCDVILHAGDFTYNGDFFEVRDFLDWLDAQPATHKIFIAGNHDYTLDKNHPKYNANTHSFVKNYGNSLVYLEDSDITINGIKIYGTPWTPWFHSWGFNGRRNGSFYGTKQLSEQYAQIPDDTNIIICHGPVANILDRTMDDRGTGSEEMANEIKRLKQLKLYVSGHIHEARGQLEKDGIKYINASSLDRSYTFVQEPIVLDYN